MTLGRKWNVKTDLLFPKKKKLSEGIETPKENSECTGIPLPTVYRVVKTAGARKGIEQQKGPRRKLNETDRRRHGQMGCFGKYKTNTFPD